MPNVTRTGSPEKILPPPSPLPSKKPNREPPYRRYITQEMTDLDLTQFFIIIINSMVYHLLFPLMLAGEQRPWLSMLSPKQNNIPFFYLK
jgi:hypothetical protein